LRNETKKQLKKNFDIKEFHQLLLENGAIPLEILRDMVKEYLRIKGKHSG
jgi:uncharacterized protein (DUF885 family)